MDRDDAEEALVRAAREGGGDDELAAPLHALREELLVPAPAQARWNHLAAMRRAASDPTAEQTVEPAVDVAAGAEAPRRRSPRAVVLVAAATVGVVGLTGGLAAAGRLPRVAQDRVADVAEIVGVELPRHDDSSTDVDRPTPPTTTPGVSGTAPAAGARGPGATGTLPGSSGSAPGHSPTGPGSSERAPGHTKDTSGNAGTTPPGSSGSAPGQSGGAPGHGGSPPNPPNPPSVPTTAPGSSGTAPGRSGGEPGNSGAAPGQRKKQTGAPSVAPGSSGTAPGHTKGTAGSSSVQGTDQ
jgi:hypothetical protein